MAPFRDIATISRAAMAQRFSSKASQIKAAAGRNAPKKQLLVFRVKMGETL